MKKTASETIVLPHAMYGGGLVRSWVRFWFTPVDPIGLHIVRLLSGVLFIGCLLSLSDQLDAFFGLGGLLDRPGYTETEELLKAAGSPIRVGWSILYVCGNNATLLAVTYWVSLLVLVLFTAGVATRITSVLSWVVMASFTANPGIESEADVLLLILAFYLMIGYLLTGTKGALVKSANQQHRSVLRTLLGALITWPLGRGATVRRPSVGANVALRLLQVHLAIAMVATGFHKLQFGDWWSGQALLYPLNPPLEATIESFTATKQHIASLQILLGLAAYAVLAWEIGFPVFAWRGRLGRILLLGGALIGWVGTAVLYRLPLFGPAVVIGCLSYVSVEEWGRVRFVLTRWLGLRGLLHPETQPSKQRPRPEKDQENVVTSITREPR